MPPLRAAVVDILEIRLADGIGGTALTFLGGKVKMSRPLSKSHLAN
jgi:hypothetical protein